MAFRLALLLVLVSVTLSGQAAHGQEPVGASEPLAYGPIGTIAAPHGAGVILTNVATGDEQLLAVMPPVGVSGTLRGRRTARGSRSAGSGDSRASVLGDLTSWCCRPLAARHCPWPRMIEMAPFWVPPPGSRTARGSTTIICRPPGGGQCAGDVRAD